MLSLVVSVPQMTSWRVCPPPVCFSASPRSFLSVLSFLVFFFVHTRKGKGESTTIIALHGGNTRSGGRSPRWSSLCTQAWCAVPGCVGTIGRRPVDPCDTGGVGPAADGEPRSGLEPRPPARRLGGETSGGRRSGGRWRSSRWRPSRAPTGQVLGPSVTGRRFTPVARGSWAT